MTKPTASGIVLIHKPRGMTSFGVVSRLRKLTGIRRIGHCGTLDPFAEGLLPVCIGRATAAVRYMDGYDKSYRVVVRFGSATDTMDPEGQVTNQYRWEKGELEQMSADGFSRLKEIVAQLVGEHQQTPPMFSAVKVSGKPLYRYAREGLTIERKTRRIVISAAELEDIQCRPLDGYLTASVRIDCSKGTYIRVIADEIGQLLGCFAHAQELIRLSCGPFRLEQASDIEDLFEWYRALPDPSTFVKLIHDKKILLPTEAAFVGFRSVQLSESDAIRLIQGQTVLLNEFCPLPDSHSEKDKPIAVYARDCLIAIGTLDQQADPNCLKTERVLVDLEDFRSGRTGNPTM